MLTEGAPSAVGHGRLVEDVVELQDDELAAIFGMAKEVKRGLEDGSYWVEQQQVVTFLLSTIARCAAATWASCSGSILGSASSTTR